MGEIKYLNDTGLGHLVDKIKEALAEKQVKGDYAQLVNGKVPSGMLPAYVDDVVEFSMPDKGLKILQNSIGSWTKVIYDSNTKRFYATQGAEVEDSSSLTPEGVAKPKLLVVYDNWSERENYQELTTNVPYSGKIYIDVEGNKSYRWSGSKLGEISPSVSLGETASTAYPGNKGAANAEKIESIKAALEKKQPKGDYAQIVNGKIETQVLPFSVSDVLEFSMPNKRLKILNSSSVDWTKIIYNSDTKRFYATQCAEVEDSSSLTPEGVAKPKLLVVYDNWAEREKYQNLLTNVPYSGKLYIDIESNKSYRWNGSELEEISAPLGLGETENTAFPGNKGAANTEKIESILNGDLPLASLSITPSWKAYTQTGEVVTLPSTSSLSTIYGYKVTFAGKYKWTKDDVHKAPTAVAGGDWAAKALPASGEFSEEITVANITSDRTFTAKVSAKKQGLVLVNGIIRQADSTDLDYSSASARVHFQYKCVAASVSEAAPSASTLTSLLTSVVVPTPSKKYELRDGKSKTATGVTTNSTSYYMYAYPSVLGNLSKIVMNDATPLLDGGFNLTKVTVTDPDTKKELEYNVYTSVQRGAFTNAKLDFA